MRWTILVALPLLPFLTGLTSASSWLMPCAQRWLVDVPPGARQAALGEAGSVVSSGPLAAWWNPAGLADLDAPGLSAESRASQPSMAWLDRSRSEFALALPARWLKGGVALSYDRQDYGDGFFHRADPESPNFNDDYDLQAGLSVGTHLTQALRGGITVKWIHMRAEMRSGLWPPTDIVGKSWALDLGLQWKVPARIPLQAGLVLADMGPEFRYNLDLGKDPLPSHLRMGIAATPLKLKGLDLSLAAEVRKGLVDRFIDHLTPLIGDANNDGVDGALYWDEDFNLTEDATDAQGHPRARAYQASYQQVLPPRSLLTSWFRHGVKEELHQTSYHLGAEVSRPFELPRLGACRAALRGGRLVDVSEGRRSWTWGLGLEAWHVSLDYSREIQVSKGDNWAFKNWDRNQRLSLGLNF
jgi:hypothetical protein